MGMSDAQYKDVLRRDLKTFQDLKAITEKLAESKEKEELIKEIDGEISRITASLQD